MIIATENLIDPAELAIPPYPVRKFSVAEYERLSRTGVLQEDDSVELLEGWIVPKMTKNPLHDATIDILDELIGSLLPLGWFCRTQNVLLTGDSAPEPDLVIARGKPADYLDQHPTSRDVAIVIEVADTSVDRDWKKRRIYARAGVTTYWIVDLTANCVEAFELPNMPAADFSRHQRFAPPASVTFSLPSGVAISVPLAEVFVRARN